MERFQVREYLLPGGRSPFREWLDSLEVTVKARVQARVFRFETGNLGKTRSVGGGVIEAKLDFGPGWRIYFGRMGDAWVILLAGSDKKGQPKAIMTARKYWTDFQSRGRT